MKQIKIMVIDDHQIFIDGLASIFATEQFYKIAGSATEAEDAIVAAEGLYPDVILLDINIDGVDGLSLIPRLKSKLPQVYIIVITMYNDPRLINEAFDRQADGFLLKSAGKAELMLAIETVLNGQKYRFDETNKHKTNNEDSQLLNNYPDEFLKKYKLTKRETDVLILMAQSMSTKEIAEKLGISEMTVSTHRKHIKAKLNVKNLADIVKFAFDYHLV